MLQEQFLEIGVGVGLGGALIGAILLIRHLNKAEREARKDELDMVVHLRDKDEGRR